MPCYIVVRSMGGPLGLQRTSGHCESSAAPSSLRPGHEPSHKPDHQRYDHSSLSRHDEDAVHLSSSHGLEKRCCSTAHWTLHWPGRTGGFDCHLYSTGSTGRRAGTHAESMQKNCREALPVKLGSRPGLHTASLLGRGHSI
jgi:hypothetical protein